jgi:hypothetical protein
MFSSILGNVTAVEGMIEAFIRRYPERADVLWDTFMTVRPHAALQVEDSVWQHHVHELLTRVVHGLDLQAPTTAELAAWILGTMLSEGEDVAGITTPDENGDMLGLAYVMGRVSQQPPYVIRNCWNMPRAWRTATSRTPAVGMSVCRWNANGILWVQRMFRQR